MDYQKEVAEEIKEKSRFYRERLKKIKANKPTLERIAQLVEGMEFKRAFFFYEHVELDLHTIKAARELTSFFMESTEIAKFTKTTESRNEGLYWYYAAHLNGVEVRIGPAPADKRCQPVKKTYENHYWVCEKI